MDYQIFLRHWGFEEYIPAFENEGITDESFRLLDAETMNVIFKKKGPLLLFKKHFNEYMDSADHTAAPLAAPVVLVDNFESQSDSLSNVSTSSNSSDHQQHDFKEVFLEEFDSSISPIFKVPAVPASSSKRTSTIEVDPDPPEYSLLQKKIKHTHSIFPYGLEQYLTKDPEGKIILSCRSKLKGYLRQKIAKVVVAYLISRHLENVNYEIKSDTFAQAAKEIVQIFPTEKEETYYVPFSNKGGLRQPARGKLWSRYINVKAALRAADGNKKLLSSKIVEEELDLNNPHYLFLKSAVEPYHKVLEAWELTIDFRNALHKSTTLEDIYNDFPVLKTQLGIQLLELDFNHKNEDKIDIIYAEWPKVASAIIKEASERQTRSYEDVSEYSTRALLTLPFLFSPVTLKKSGKSAWRPTRIEVQESFFFIEKSLDDLDHHLERRTAKLDSYDIPLQPFGVGIGENLNSLEGFYVIINQVKYKCDSSIRCLELLFKGIHALSLQYPPESKQIFLTIQDLVFKMGSSGKSGASASVIGDLLFHLKQDN